MSSRLLTAGELAERLEHDGTRVVDRLIHARPGELAHELADGRERQLARRGRALDAHDARVRRELADERVDERGLADAHLADDHARRHLTDAVFLRRRDRPVVRGVQIGELRVATDQIARRVRHLIASFSSRVSGRSSA